MIKRKHRPLYSYLYIDEFSEEVGYVFEIISRRECDIIRTLDFFLGSSVFRVIYDIASSKYLNMSAHQLIECISHDDGFEWYNTKPPKDSEDIDPNIMEWVGNLITRFQWAYSVDFTDWLKYFSVLDVYHTYYPLSEASYETASRKLYEHYMYKKKHKQFR